MLSVDMRSAATAGHTRLHRARDASSDDIHAADDRVYDATDQTKGSICSVRAVNDDDVRSNGKKLKKGQK